MAARILGEAAETARSNKGENAMRIAQTSLLAGLAFACIAPSHAKLIDRASPASKPLSDGQFQEARCRAGQVYLPFSVRPIYGTRFGRTGVIDIIYIEGGCYDEF